MSSIYDYNDDGFRIKQQLAWLNYNMALSSIKEREWIPSSPPIPSPEVCKDTDGAENGNLWIVARDSPEQRILGGIVSFLLPKASEPW